MKIKKWFEDNWIRVILWVAIISIFVGITVFYWYGCNNGWIDCTPTNMTFFEG